MKGASEYSPTKESTTEPFTRVESREAGIAADWLLIGLGSRLLSPKALTAPSRPVISVADVVCGRDAAVQAVSSRRQRTAFRLLSLGEGHERHSSSEACEVAGESESASLEFHSLDESEALSVRDEEPEEEETELDRDLLPQTCGRDHGPAAVLSFASV